MQVARELNDLKSKGGKSGYSVQDLKGLAFNLHKFVNNHLKNVELDEVEEKEMMQKLMIEAHNMSPVF